VMVSVFNFRKIILKIRMTATEIVDNVNLKIFMTTWTKIKIKMNMVKKMTRNTTMKKLLVKKTFRKFSWTMNAITIKDRVHRIRVKSALATKLKTKVATKVETKVKDNQTTKHQVVDKGKKLVFPLRRGRF